MRLPVDSVDLRFDYDAEVKDFFQSAGPIYSITCFVLRELQPSTINVLIDKFVPVDGGRFCLYNHMSRKELETLIVKCKMADKMVTINMFLDDSMHSSELKDLFDFDKYYPQRKIKHQEIYAFGKGTKMNLRVRRLHDLEVEWKWMEQQEYTKKKNRYRIVGY
uniref:FTH domain-containing protein n=1 Tax=Steinernema glaseri TaxID=37863 RepID=A0A1I7ZBB0_9BILA